MNTNPHVVQPSYSTVLSGVPSHVTEMSSHHLPGWGRQNLPEATEEGVKAQSLGGPAPSPSAGEGPRVSVQTSEGTAGTFILANIVLKHLVFGMSGV